MRMTQNWVGLHLRSFDFGQDTKGFAFIDEQRTRD